MKWNGQKKTTKKDSCTLYFFYVRDRICLLWSCTPLLTPFSFGNCNWRVLAFTNGPKSAFCSVYQQLGRKIARRCFWSDSHAMYSTIVWKKLWSWIWIFLKVAKSQNVFFFICVLSSEKRHKTTVHQVVIGQWFLHFRFKDWLRMEISWFFAFMRIIVHNLFIKNLWFIEWKLRKFSMK